MSRNLLYFLFTVLSLKLSIVVCQNETDTTTDAPISSSTQTTVDILTSTQTPKNISCESHNGDCKACVGNSDCYYCETDSICHIMPTTKILTGEKCDLKKIHYLTCKVNFQYLMIGIGVFAGIAILVITIFCCYCCCKKKGVKLSKSDLKWARQREERKQIAAEKRKERAERTEEIRRKYGLVKDSNPYQKFDDDA